MAFASVENRVAGPVGPSERSVVLDVLRGLALLGIALANFPELSLYSFLPPEAAEALPTAGFDRVVRYLQYLFVDGKFYTIFSASASPLSSPMRHGAVSTDSGSSTGAWRSCC